MDKKEVRKIYKNIRDQISPNKKAEFDKDISNTLINSKEYKDASNVLLFSSFGSEFDTKYIFEDCIKNNKNVFFPKCINNGIMNFYQVKELEDLIPGAYGILEPREDLPMYNIQNSNNSDLLISPALSFDKSFYRMGYGGGYYDRFLSKFSGISICPIYSCLSCDILPRDQYDIPMDIIITENGNIEKEKNYG